MLTILNPPVPSGVPKIDFSIDQPDVSGLVVTFIINTINLSVFIGAVGKSTKNIPYKILPATEQQLDPPTTVTRIEGTGWIAASLEDSIITFTNLAGALALTKFYGVLTMLNMTETTRSAALSPKKIFNEHLLFDAGYNATA
jgi:hypothetical protein